MDKLNFWAQIESDYLSELRIADPTSQGIQISCPSCRKNSWIRLPAKPYGHIPIIICCPSDCGYAGDLLSFASFSSPPLEGYDSHITCGRDGAEFKFAGKIFRCPVCAIENPREIMRAKRDDCLRLPAESSEDCLADSLGAVVSTFDGVMRVSNRIAVRNATRLEIPHPVIKSFQDIKSAQLALTPLMRIEATVANWDTFVTMFQKRHAFAHNLGVIDQKYIDKTGVSPDQLGRTVHLTRLEVTDFAENCLKVVNRYFGLFLS